MIIPVPDAIPSADTLGQVHFVGIGGAALSGIARIMAERGITVTGSDDQETPFLPQLRELGVTVHRGYAAEHVGAADTVVVTTAAREENPEVVEARRRELRMLPRSAGLESVMQGQRVVAVAGTHGKTTTTSLLTTALLRAGLDPSYAVGGMLSTTGHNAHSGTDDLFVVEADESDRAFLVYRPHAAVVTNVVADHLDYFVTEAAYQAAFEEFLARIAPAGFLVACVDDPGAAALADRGRGQGIRVIGVGEHPSADLRAEKLEFAGAGSQFAAVRGQETLGTVRLQIPGRHYVLDALAALAAGLELGCRFADLAGGLEAFTGTRRRMELKGERDGVRVYDSYAHHPNEIAGDLEAARALAGGGRIVAAFQPHLVSRTRLLAAEMAAALAAADEVVVMDVYVAREDAEPGVDGGLVAAQVPLPAAQVLFEPTWSRTQEHLVERARPGDLVITLGAGDVTQVGPQVLDLLAERERSRGAADA